MWLAQDGLFSKCSLALPGPLPCPIRYSLYPEGKALVRAKPQETLKGSAAHPQDVSSHSNHPFYSCLPQSLLLFNKCVLAVTLAQSCAEFTDKMADKPYGWSPLKETGWNRYSAEIKLWLQIAFRAAQREVYWKSFEALLQMGGRGSPSKEER